MVKSFAESSGLDSRFKPTPTAVDNKPPLPLLDVLVELVLNELFI